MSVVLPSNLSSPFLCVLPESNILFKQSFISPPPPGFAESWKWCQVLVDSSEHVGHPPAMHVNVGPVILIRTFTGHMHLLHFQITTKQMTFEKLSSELTSSNI